MIGNIPLLYLEFENEEIPLLKTIIDAVSNQIEKSVVFMINHRIDGSVNFLCRSRSENINAGYLVKNASLLQGGNGGGNMTFAQGGGKSHDLCISWSKLSCPFKRRRIDLRKSFSRRREIYLWNRGNFSFYSFRTYKYHFLFVS